MDRGKTFPFLIVLLGGSLWLSGCSRSNHSDEEDVEEGGVAEVADDSESAPRRPATAVAATAAPAQSVAPIAAPPLRNVWPFIKTVTHHVRQPNAEGAALDCRSTLVLMMTIARDDGRSGAHPQLPEGQRYRVGFDLVRYTRELPGQSPVVYDSRDTTGAVPVEMRPYQGLRGNGFQFELDRQLQLAHVQGFEPFLERCLLTVPPEQQASVRSALPVTSPTDGVALFIDETIGLIPPEMARAGDSWARSRSIAGPAPCVTTIRYTIRQLTAEVAEVDLSGTIEALSNASASTAVTSSVPIQIRGGQLLGQCRIDRRSGIPLKSHVEQSLEMTVKSTDGVEFAQHKSTVTTLDLVSENPAAPPGGSAGQSAPAQISSRTPGQPSSAPGLRR